MSQELESVIERCVTLLTQGPTRTRDEMAALLTRWEEMGLISRQMRAVIVQRLRMTSPADPAGTPSITRRPDPAGGDSDAT